MKIEEYEINKCNSNFNFFNTICPLCYTILVFHPYEYDSNSCIIIEWN